MDRLTRWSGRCDIARDQESLKIRRWAETGDRTNPDDPSLSPALERTTGWPLLFEQIGGQGPRRRVFNQIIREMTGMLVELNEHGGILDWDVSIAYVHPALVWRGETVYLSRRNNIGQDPETAVADWQPWGLHPLVSAAADQVNTGATVIQSLTFDDDGHVIGAVSSSIEAGADFPVKGSELTIANGSVTPTHTYHEIDTEGNDATDDLTAIATSNVADGDVLILRAANNSRTVVVKHGSSIQLSDGQDFSLDSRSKAIMLQLYGAVWGEISRSALHPDISPADGQANTGATFVQSLTFDNDGHVTGAVSADVPSRFPNQGSELTLSSNEITPTETFHRVDTEGNTDTDNLDTINATNFVNGSMLVIQPANAARTIVVRGSGNINLITGQVSLTEAHHAAVFILRDGEWDLVTHNVLGILATVPVTISTSNVPDSLSNGAWYIQTEV